MRLKNPKRKGSEFERDVKKDLKSKGFFCIRQSASAFPDLVAIRKKEVIFIECKVCKYISSEERNMLKDIVNLFGGKAIIAYKEGKDIVYCDTEYRKVFIEDSEVSK